VDQEADKEKEKEKEEDKAPPPEGNGGQTDKYKWSQTLKELNLSSEIDEKYTAKQVKVTFTKNHLKIVLGGQVFVDADLFKEIKVSNCNWTLDSETGKLKNTKSLAIYIEKSNQMEWWDCVCIGDPTIDPKTIVPENSKLDDLDSDTRVTVEKMMFDQRQKQLGLPSSDDLQKRSQLSKFMAAHPEMDFSKTKFS